MTGCPCILMVDDEPDLERLVRQRMRRDIRAGRYKFDFALNGVEALERLGGNGGISLVLSDINMPEMDGLTLLRRLPGVAPDLRAIVVSAYGDERNIRDAMDLGAYDFLTKPIDFERMRGAIDRALLEG